MNPDLLNEVRWLDDKRDEMLATLIEWCNINSFARNPAGLARMVDLLEQAWRPLGGQIELLDTDGQEHVDDRGEVVHEPLGQLLRITCRPELRPRVLLCIHMDTVYSTDDSFQQCRWLDQDRLNGPGVIDAKGGLVTMLYALRSLEQSPLARHLGWQVIINPDEEIGSPGSQRLLDQAARAADVGLLFEPSLPDGRLVSWRKGVGNFVFVVRGKSAHSGRDFAAGRNAVVAMSQLMLRIHELNTDPEVTFNIGRVSGGGALNVVPDLAIGRVNVRVRTLDQQRTVEKQLRELTAAAEADGISATMQGGFTSPPKELIPGTDVLQRRIEAAGALLGLPVAWHGSGGASDGNKFAAAGLPNIDSLGPAGGEIHSSSEFLIASSLVPRTQLAALVLLSMAEEAALV